MVVVCRWSWGGKYFLLNWHTHTIYKKHQGLQIMVKITTSEILESNISKCCSLFFFNHYLIVSLKCYVRVVSQKCCWMIKILCNSFHVSFSFVCQAMWNRLAGNGTLMCIYGNSLCWVKWNNKTAFPLIHWRTGDSLGTEINDILIKNVNLHWD